MINKLHLPILTATLLGSIAVGNVFVGMKASCLSAVAEADSHDHSLAQEAYYQIEGNVFNWRKIQDAVSKIEEAEKQDPNDPWVYLASSLYFIVKGYGGRDWYSMSNFDKDSVYRAGELAEKAVQVDSEESQTHAHFGRLMILLEAYDKAEASLDEAMDLNKKSFYPWYFKGILYEKLHQWDDALHHFKEAEKRVKFKFHHIIVNAHRQRVAVYLEDLGKKEELLKLNIKNNPENKWMYDNYADFLVGQKRYREAIEMWEKANAIEPYTRATQKILETQQKMGLNN